MWLPGAVGEQQSRLHAEHLGNEEVGVYADTVAGLFYPVHGFSVEAGPVSE